MKGMPPKLMSDDGKHIVIARWPTAARKIFSALPMQKRSDYSVQPVRFTA